MAQQVTIDAAVLAAVDFADVAPHIEWNDSAKRFLVAEAGREPYRLIACLAAVLKDSDRAMVDIGTYMGTSALALALDAHQPVVTYDVFDWVASKAPPVAQTVKTRANVTAKVMDCRTSSELNNVLKTAPLIVLDIDPHDGIEERAIMADLEHVGYSGVVVTDDIHLNQSMETFWAGVAGNHKVDATALGHWSGTGLVYYDGATADSIRLMC